jgi:pimeloyl-ACP methyl ester carboxylesterase
MPQEPVEASVDLNGISLHYELRGDGPPLLLLHGGTGCHSDWAYAGREFFEREFRLIIPDARGHGRSAVPDWSQLPQMLTHRQCALDTLALLDHLGIERCKAIGVSMGGNILLHMATLQPDRVEAMVTVSATPYFPEQARKVMAAVPAPDAQPASEWERMRRSHPHGDQQIRALWEWGRSLKDSRDDLNFTPADLAKIRARTLIIQGDRDFLYPVELSVEMYRAIPNSALWIVPGGSHGPIFMDRAAQFAQIASEFLRG